MRKRLFEIIEIANPGDKLSSVYDKGMMICIIISIIPLCFKEKYTAFTVVEHITTAIYIIDYILRLITADFKLKRGKFASIIQYPFTLFALIDLLSILPAIISINSGFRLFRLFRLNKAFKTLKFLRYSKNFNIILRVVKKQKQSLLTVCYLSLGYVLLSALVMFSAEPQNFDSFFDAIYWATVTLTTVGYGDIYPVSDIGRIISMLSSFMGIAIVALPTGIITAGFMDELDKNKKDL